MTDSIDQVVSRRHYESSHLLGVINLPYEFVDDACVPQVIVGIRE